jgi:cation:H+ antiporter
MPDWLHYLLFAVGFVLLIKGADFLVEGASHIARRYGIPSLVVGLTIVAFGTHVPELVIGALSALSSEKGAIEIALGNSIGSNIFNTLVVGGVASVIAPIHAKPTTVWKEIPFSILAVGVLYILANHHMIDGFRDNVISRSDGIIMLTFFILFVIYIFELALKHKEEVLSENSACDLAELDDPEKEKIEQIKPMWKHVVAILGGLIALIIGGEWVVDGAIRIAKHFNLSEYVISTTIVAAGTSLPELAATVIAAMKKEHDICMGNIVGSNIFNILFALGVTSTIRPIPVRLGVNYDLVFLIIITLFMFLFMFTGEKKEARYKLHRMEGAFFLLLYVGYIAYVILRGAM